MALERKTRLSAIQIEDDGTLSIRLKKSIVVDGEVLKEEPHRFVVEPGIDPVKRMTGVKLALEKDGFEPPPDIDQELLDAVVKQRHTDEVKEQFAERKAREAARARLVVPGGRP